MSASIEILSPQLVLIDRDGVINVNSPAYIASPDDWRPLPGALDAIARLQANGRQVAICTNQAGIARGHFTEDDLHRVHVKVNRSIEAAGGTQVDIFYCSHHPEERCTCRKPASGLLKSAMRAHRATPESTVYIGDSEKDLLAADSAGCVGLLVLTGNGRDTVHTERGSVAPVFEDLLSAANSLINAADRGLNTG